MFSRLLKFFHKTEIDPKKNLAIRQVLSVMKPRSFPTRKQWKQLPTVMNVLEKRYFIGAIILVLISSASLIVMYIVAHRIEIPSVGGETTEALVGDPRLINPLYATTNDVDADLTSLVYSGLIKWSPKDGYINDLAESMENNPEQTQYTFHIRKNAKFSNGDPVLARDVVFTFSAIQNPAYRSPLISLFRSVKIEQIDDQTVLFTLKDASPSFLKNLTIGILPENIWSDIVPQNVPLATLNTQPIGSGPYQFQKFTKDQKGSIRSYTLKRNSHYYGVEPKIDQLTFKFYPDESSASQALINKNVESVGYVAFEHRAITENNRSVNMIYASLPKGTLLFFNQKNNNLNSPSVRLAIAQAIDKNALINSILSAHARVWNGPLFSETLGFDENFQGNTFNQSTAEELLDAAGYKKNEGSLIRIQTPKQEIKKNEPPAIPVEPTQLTFTLVTTSNGELSNVAEAIKQNLEKIGIGITINTVNTDRLLSDVIEPKSFDLLLTSQYGAIEADPYLFWHSSQSGKNGLNILGYKNTDADKLLEKIHSAASKDDRSSAALQFQNILIKDLPAVFLYQSTYSYTIAKKNHAEAAEKLRIPSDRFWNVSSWYIKTKKTLK